MIAYLKGEIIDIREDNLILEVNNIGYNIRISAGTAGLLPGIGETVKIYTYTHVREDAFLSVMSADDLRFAILSGDAKAIAKAPGIGAKTAERIILDLRDKVSIDESFVGRQMDVQGTSGKNGNIGRVRNEAAEALAALGYSPSEALKAVKQVQISEDMDTEGVLKLALKTMNR